MPSASRDAPGGVAVTVEAISVMPYDVWIGSPTATASSMTAGGIALPPRRIAFVPASRYALGDEPLAFPALQRHTARRGEILLGIRLAPRDDEPGSVRLNPPRHLPWTLGPTDDLIVLATYA